MRVLMSLAACVLLAGCGGGSDYDGDQRFPLTGKVTFNNEPVEGGMISFVPQSSDLRTAGGPITNGVYSIAEGQGVTAGSYKVEIRWSRPTGEKKLDATDTGEMIDVTEQVIPEKYNTNSELTADVASDKTTFDFTLNAE